MEEIERAKMKLDKLTKENKRLEQEHDELNETVNSQKEQSKGLANENVELRSMLKDTQKRLHRQEEDHKVKDVKIRQLMDESHNFKQELPKLRKKVQKYKAKLEAGA